MMSASRSRAGAEPDARLGERLDLVGDDLGAAGGDLREQVAVGDQAEALVPGVVARVEVGVDRIARRQSGGDRLAEQAPHQPGEAAAEAVAQHLQGDVLGADQRVGDPRGQPAAQRDRDAVAGRERGHVGRRALQHRHARRLLAQRRDQRHRGGAAADHDDPLAGVVEVVRPVLGMDDRAGEALAARELGRVSLVVAEVAGAAAEPAAGDLGRLDLPVGAGPLDLDVPERLGARPLGANDAMAEADLVGDVVLAPRSPRGSRGSSAPARSPPAAPMAGTRSRACTCRSRSGSRGSGTGPRCRRSRRVPRGSRSSCRGSARGGGRRR